MGIRPVMRYASTILLVAATFVVDGCAGTAAARKDGVAAPAPLPQPLAFWTFQEPTGAPRVSTRARHSYALADGDAAHPVESTSSEGLFGPRAVNFTATSPTQRLRAVRSAVPALTTDLAGPEAVVSVVAWVKRPTGRYFHGFLAGVWGDADGDLGPKAQNARQYALYFDLGACNGEAGHSGIRYAHGLAAHISNSGGPTPGHPYCVTAACDPRSLPASDWHCVANVYDGKQIKAYVNGSLKSNKNVNPYVYPGGIYSPETANRSSAGAEFGVGVSMSFGVNQFVGLLGGLVVFNESLTSDQVTQVCDWPRLKTEDTAGAKISGGGRADGNSFGTKLWMDSTQDAETRPANAWNLVV